VPGGVDLLVAGFSCVDFSSLNGNKKVLEERGESGDTFFSMREYAKVYRPRVIILENVLNAPWDHLKEQERFKKKQTQNKKKESTKNTTKEADTVNNSEQMNTSKKDNEVKDGSKGSQSTAIQPDVSQPNEDGSDEDKPRTGLDYLMGEVGYATKYVIVDTKDYYLPQTRQRGYMVCIDRMSYLEEKISSDTFFSGWEAKPLVNKCGDHQLLGIDTDLNKWKSIIMEKLKRPASVPAEMLFLRSDDPALEALSRMDDHISTRKATAWDTCRIGYNNYRETESLGKKRELTEWVNGGAFVAEDFWKRHTKGIGERVLDTLDVAHLRNLRRGLDDRYAK
jgi:site-specific DNA-cytosine methylase